MTQSPSSVGLRIFAFLLALVVLAPGGQPAVAAPPSCTRGGAKILAWRGPIIVVRAPARPFDKNAPADTDLLTCWHPTGKRGLITREYTAGSGTFSDTDVDITMFGGHYVGTIYGYGDGESHTTEANVVDAHTGKRVHSTQKCNDGDSGGIREVVFLRKGGMAFACVTSLNLFRTAAAGPPKVVDRSDAGNIGDLAVSASGSRLYWTVQETLGDGTTRSTVKSLEL